MTADAFGRKPWEIPVRYVDDEVPAAAAPEHPGESPPPPRPPRPARDNNFVSLDTEPLDYRKGDPSAVIDLDDHDEAAPEDFGLTPESDGRYSVESYEEADYLEEEDNEE